MAYWDRAEVTELKTLFCEPNVLKNVDLLLKVVQKVIVSMTMGSDVSSLFSDMIKISDTPNVVLKKLVYLYLGYYAKTNSDLAIMALNTLRKDLEDRDPMIRGLALRTLSSLRFTKVVKYLHELMHTGLNDSSAYVRKTAVMGVVKLFHVDPHIIDKMNFVDILYQMLRDHDPQVVSNCIAALSEILASEGGMVVNTKIAYYLLNRLHEFSEWGQSQILELLLRYSVISETDLFDILNILDIKLRSSNCGVVLSVVHLFLHYTKDMPQLHADVCNRIHEPMLTFACYDYIDLAYIYLQHIQLMVTQFPQMWRKDYQNFYCRYTDPLHVKVKKVEILADICMFESATQILDELSEYVTDSSYILARSTIQAFRRIAQRIPSKANTCVEKLLLFLSYQVDHITAETMVALTCILRKFDNLLDYILPKLSSCRLVSDSTGKSAYIWILGEYGESLPNTPYVLEELVGGIAEESSSEVRLQLLTAVMKMFFKRPPESQEMLGRLLEYIIDEEDNADVRDRAMLYYRLLKSNIKMAKKVVCGAPKVIEEPPQFCSDKGILFPEFNTLSVAFEKTSVEFISQEFPYIIARGKVLIINGADTSFEIERSSNCVSIECEGFQNIAFNSEAKLSPGEFERKWNGLKIVKELHLHLERVPSQSEFIKTLDSHNIFNMAASSSSNQDIIKYFFYAQNKFNLHFFLIEVNVTLQNSILAFILKCEDPKEAGRFTRCFLKIHNLSGDQVPSMTECTTCSDIPTGMSKAYGIFYNNQLHVGGGHTDNARADSIIYAYSPDVDMWKVLPPCPLKWFAMAVWRDQLVLLGGKETCSKENVMTNKVIVWEDGKWEPSLPPMLLARVSPITVAHGDHLAVIGGRSGYLGVSVEVLESGSIEWCSVKSIPISSSIHTSTVCDGYLYLLHQETGRVLQANVSAIVRHREDSSSHTCSSEETESLGSQASEIDVEEDGSVWKYLPKLPTSPMMLASVGGYMVTLSHGNTGEGNMKVHGYFPETKSWSFIGYLPTITPCTTCITSPEKRLYIAGGRSINSQYSQKLYQAELQAS